MLRTTLTSQKLNRSFNKSLNLCWTLLRWKVDWREYLTTTQNFIHVSIDGRGTGYQSDEYRFAVYRNMGTLEMTDQIEVTRQLVAQNSFISPDQVAIWGWSYGGFATAMTLEADIGENPVFSCGISGN